MSDKLLNRLIAVGVFLVTLIVYFKTLSVTVVFWDVGEFIAAARLLQVPHPPGAPLFIIIGRLVSTIPFFPDIAARVHAISAVASALSIMFSYLVAVKLINRMRGLMTSTFDRIMVYGSSAIGAFALAFSTSNWDNAIEAEVYGLSMFFVTVIVWLALRWWDKAEDLHNEKYILLIAYLVGLSVGVHLLAVLAIFSVLMIVYFRLYVVTKQTAVRFSLLALGIFFVVYPGVVQLLPSMLDGDLKIGDQVYANSLIKAIPFICGAAAIFYAYKSYKERRRLLHIACMSFLLIVLGYTTYTVVLIRANVPNLPMNENNPGDLAGLTAYLGREQYGDTPILKGESWDNNLQNFREKFFPRRHSREAMHEPTRKNYTSDFDFMWRYQINHMFTRYLLWNYVGQEGSWQDAGVEWKRTFGIPLIMALLGIYFHFKKDWKLALTLMVMFLTMGVVLALYQNQQEPQPRERDYFYGGAYYVMALWIALGVYGLIDFLRAYVKSPSAYQGVSAGALAVLALAIPINLVKINWFEHDRSQNYVAWDYSYNLLQSCKENSILFTNGDNDTFPLWYLQDVEGVRRDIRIVNLSLVNTQWYIAQMKHNEPHGAQKVPVSLTDQQIKNITPVRWEPRDVDLPVPGDVAKRYLELTGRESGAIVVDSSALAQGKIRYRLEGIPFRDDIRVLRVQDIMVHNIVTTNAWKRPVYFAVTVSPDSKAGLDNYLWMVGQAYELRPVKVGADDGGIDLDIMSKNVLAENVTPSKTPQYGFLYRNLNNHNVSYNENIQRMVINYRAGFMRLADYASRVEENKAKARAIMDKMEEILPIDVVPVLEWRYLVYMMRLNRDFGDSTRAAFYSAKVEENCNGVLDNKSSEPRSKLEAIQTLLEIFDARKDYTSSLALLNRISPDYPNDPEIKRRIDYYHSLQKTAGQDTNKPS